MMKRRPADRKPTNRLGALAGAVPDRRGSATAQDAPWETIALSLPPDTPLAVPAHPARWQRRDGRTLATYTREELALAVRLALEEQRRDLEARLEWALELLAASTGCDDAQAERLLAHWETLNAEYTATVTALAAVSQSVNSENPALKDQ